MDADRRADEIVVEEVPHAARRRLPADVPHLPRAQLAVFGVRLGRVVVVPGLGGPRRVDLRVERPVRQVDAVHGVGQRGSLQPVRREPQPAVPRADAVARRAFADPERQHAFRAERRLGFVVRHDLRRPAEVAVLRLPRRIEDRDRVAALALDLPPRRLPAAAVVADPAQRGDEIVLGDAAGGVELRRRLGAAERADELLLGGAPVRLAAAGGTRELRQRRGFRRHGLAPGAQAMR